MTNPLRWTEDELRNYQHRRDARGLLCSPSKGIAPAPKVERPTESKIERRFAQQLYESDIPPHFRNWFFMKDRDFELDFAWPEAMIAVEVQGMAHRIKAKFKRDIEKRALALLAGWRVLEVGGDEVRSGRAIEWLKTLLNNGRTE